MQAGFYQDWNIQSDDVALQEKTFFVLSAWVTDLQKTIPCVI